MDITILITIVIVFFSAIIQGMVGFGFALILVPLLMLIISPQLAVPIIVILALLVNLIIFLESRKHVEFSKIWKLMLAGSVGTPIGAYVLSIMNTNVIRCFAGILIVISVISLWYGIRMKTRDSNVLFFLVGLVSGFLNGATSMSGAPIVLFYSNQELSKESFRANLVIYFLFLNLITIPFFFINGVIDNTIIPYLAYLIPTMIVGTTIGVHISKIMKDHIFEKVSLSLMFVSGLMAVIKGFGLI